MGGNVHVCMTLHKKEVLRGFPSNVPPAPPDQLSVRNMAVLVILTPLKSLAPILLTVGLTKLPEVHTDSGIHCYVQKGHIYTSSVCHGTIIAPVNYTQINNYSPSFSTIFSTSKQQTHSATVNIGWQLPQEHLQEKIFYRHAFHNHEV